MSQLSYSEQIQESMEDLLVLERKAAAAIIRDRLRFLRLLKAGSTLQQAGQAVNFKKSWCYELWNRYQQQGLSALSTYPFKGTKPRLSTEKQQQFTDSLGDDSLATLHQAADLIEVQSGIRYSISGTWYALRRMGIKKKTGRPAHIHKDQHAAEAFKKKPLRW
jgi:transposase